MSVKTITILLALTVSTTTLFANASNKDNKLHIKSHKNNHDKLNIDKEKKKLKHKEKKLERKMKVNAVKAVL